MRDRARGNLLVSHILLLLGGKLPSWCFLSETVWIHDTSPVPVPGCSFSRNTARKVETFVVVITVILSIAMHTDSSATEWSYCKLNKMASHNMFG